MTRRLTPVLLALLLTACGSGGDDDDPVVQAPPTTSSPAAGLPDGTVAVTARDYSFAGLDDLAPQAGTTLELTLRNTGEHVHDLELRGPDGAPVGKVEAIDEGEAGSASVTLKAAGVYSYVCTIGSHEELGMKGTFTVH
jgi:plastocyanin